MMTAKKQRALPGVEVPPKPVAPVTHACQVFTEEHQRRFGIEPLTTKWGRFRKEIKQHIEAMGEAEVVALIQEFFTSTDWAIRRSQYTQDDFLNNLQRLRFEQRGVTPAETKREADVRSVLSRSMQRR